MDPVFNLSPEHVMDAALSKKLKQDLLVVTADAEELLKATAGQTGERIEKIRTRAEESLRAARQRLAEAGADVDEQFHKHPYTAAAIAAGIGLLVGLLAGRR
jgi:ElaB/YqjD/DUF883 family membrane-anchored ribosome-binding protein